MAINFTGKWKENRGENKEAMLRKLGVPEENVTNWAAFKIIMDIGDKFNLKTLGTDDKVMVENDITLGTPFAPKMPPGIPSMGDMICTMEDGGKIYRSRPADGKIDYIDDMTLEPNGELKSVQKYEGVESVTYFTKV